MGLTRRLVGRSFSGREGRKGNAVHHVNLAVARAVGAEARLQSQLMRCLSERWEGSGALESSPRPHLSSVPREETTCLQAFSLQIQSIFFFGCLVLSQANGTFLCYTCTSSFVHSYYYYIFFVDSF